MLIHSLAPGSVVSGLVVELVALHGAAANKSNCSNSTIYRATVRDVSGLVTLIYKPGPKCNPSGIRKGNTYIIKGQVVLEHGHVVIEAGGLTGAVEKTHAITFSQQQPHELYNFSEQQQVHAALLLSTKEQQLQVYVTSSSSSSSSSSSRSSKHVLVLPGLPLPAGIVTGSLSGAAAACRVLEHALQLAPGMYQLLPLPPAAVLLPHSGSSSSSSRTQMVHVYCALLNQECNTLVSGSEHKSGQWVSVQQLQQQWQQHGAPEQQQQQQHLCPQPWQAALQLLLGCCTAFIPTGSSSSSNKCLNSSSSSSSRCLDSSSSSRTGDRCKHHHHNTDAQDRNADQPAAEDVAHTSPQPPAAAAVSAVLPTQQQQQKRKLPVTLISGFLGAGKTTLLKHLLSTASPQQRIAVVVNDVAALNIDSALIKGGGLVQSQEQLVELQNGCICCSLRMDLVQAVARLAAAGSFDLLLLESTGVSEPLQVAEIFSADVPIELAGSSSSSGGNGDPAAAAHAAPAAGSDTTAAAAAVLLRDVAYLDTAVTVVDAHQLMHNLHSIYTFRGQAAEASPSSSASITAAAAAAAQAELSGAHRHIAELLLDQIEAADVLILNKADTVSPQECTMLQAVLSALNPTAKLLTTTRSVVHPSDVLNTGLWSPEKAQGSAAWVQLLRQNPEHGTAGGVTCAGGVTSDAKGAAAGDVVQQQHVYHHEDRDEVGHASSCCSSTACAHSHGVTDAGVTSVTSVTSGGSGVTRSTADHGITHFVYRARWPFHPGRLHQFMVKYFVLQEPDWEKLMESQEEDDQDVCSDTPISSGSSECHEDRQQQQQQQATSSSSSSSESISTAQQLQEVAASRRAAFEAQFGMLLRSKGFVWLASRSAHIGEWSQAGSILSFSTGGPWFCVLPADAWPEDPQQQAEIRADFAHGVGDRRQELVFIGLGLKQGSLQAALDKCLVTVEEAEGSGFAELEDPFEPWPDIRDMIDAGETSDNGEQQDPEAAAAQGHSQEQAIQQQQQQQPLTDIGANPAADDDDHDHDEHDDHAVAAVAVGGSVWCPGQMNSIIGGAVQLQQLLDDVLDQYNSSSSSSSSNAVADPRPAVVIEWVAPWAAASIRASQQATALAVAFPHIAVISVDVTASDANRQLALEKVMEVPQAYRKGGRKFQPVPKSGEKWPCVTLHVAPLLHPLQVFSGPQAGQQLQLQLQQMGLMVPQPKAAVAAARGCPAAAAASAAVKGAAVQQAVQSAAQPAPQQQAVQELQKGATDLKLLLQQAGSTGVLLLLWSDSSSSNNSALDAELLPLLLQRAAAFSTISGRPAIVAAAAAAASQANQALAAALNAAQVLPVLQIFHNKQLVKMVRMAGVAADDAVAKIERAVGRLQLPPITAAVQQQQEGRSGSAVQQTQQANSAGHGGSSSLQATSTAATAAVISNSSSSSNDLWDPPTGKSATPGLKKKISAAAVYTAGSSSSSVRRGSSSSSSSSTVSAVFWPRMPCLSCGCPWWLGEDWDAACARCGWTCEDDYYDDDSNPLPKYKERYSMITAALKQGKTPNDLAPLE